MIQLFAWTLLISAITIIMGLACAYMYLKKKIRNKKDKVFWIKKIEK